MNLFGWFVIVGCGGSSANVDTRLPSGLDWRRCIWCSLRHRIEENTRLGVTAVVLMLTMTKLEKTMTSTRTTQLHI